MLYPKNIVNNTIDILLNLVINKIIITFSNLYIHVIICILVTGVYVRHFISMVRPFVLQNQKYTHTHTHTRMRSNVETTLVIVSYINLFNF